MPAVREGLPGMLLIGITGQFGSGKSTVADMFARRGAKVLDADKIASRLMSKNGSCYRDIVNKFRPPLFCNGEIDRSAFGRIVFKDEKKLQSLCRVIHPVVIETIQKKISAERIQSSRSKSSLKAVIVDAPLLFETKMDRWLDYVIVVKANRQLQMERLRRRMPISKSEISRRIKNQMGIREKIRMADIVIDNRGKKNQTEKQVEEIWQTLLKRRIKK